jgi:peptide/nickel transport system substrate-binding protein
MRHLLVGRPRPWQMVLSALALVLVLVVACGSAAPAAPPESQTTDTPTTPQSPVAAQDTPAPTSAAQPAPASQDVAIHPGKAVIMVGGWGGRFTPLHSTDCHSYQMSFHDFLIRSDENRQYIPGIATEWKVSEDGRTWTVTLRDDAVFHDGTPVTAEDVEFTWLQSWGPGSIPIATSSTALNMARNVEKIEQISPNQVSITTINVDSSVSNLISDATGSCQGVVLPKKFWEGFDIFDADRTVAYDQDPVGAGPLKILDHIPEELMAFERFADYYDEERSLKISGVDLRKVPEEATRAAALRAGEVDIAPVSPDTQRQVEEGGGRIVWGQEASYMEVRPLGNWLAGTPFSKKEVRQALQYALNMKEFEALFGEGVFVPKGWSFVTPSTIGYSPELDAYPFDPEKARELLAQAGYPNGEGFGKLIINTWNSRAVPFLPESAELAANFWRTELGIDAEVRVGDETALKDAANNTGSLYGQIIWRDNEARVDGVSTLRSGFATPDNEGRSHNNPEIFGLARQGIAVIDPSQKQATLVKTYQRLRDEGYRFSIGYVNIPWGVGPRVVEWSPQPMAFYPSALHTIRLK